MPGSELIKDYATAIRASLARAVTAQLDPARACSGSKIAPMGSEQPRSNLAPMMLTSGDGAETKKTGDLSFSGYLVGSRVWLDFPPESHAHGRLQVWVATPLE